MKNEKTVFGLLVVSAVVMIVLPLLFIENYIAEGICSYLGLFLILTAERKSPSYKGVWLTAAVLCLSTAVRYIFVFGYQPIAILGSVIIIFLTTVIIAACLFLDYYLTEKKHYCLAAVVFPLVYAVNLLLSVVLNTADINNPAVVVQLIPVISQNLVWMGEFGLTFLAVLFVSLLSQAVLSEDGKVRRGDVIVSLCIVVGLIVPGFILNIQKREPDEFLRVAVAVCEESDFSDYSVDLLTKEERLEMFRKALEEAGDNNAELLVLNEEYYTVHAEDEAWTMENIRSSIAEFGIPVLMAILLVTDESAPDVNYVVFYDENGNDLFTYTKHTLVPFIEKGIVVKGDDELTSFTYSFNGKDITLSSVICMDINNSPLLSTLPKETELLIIPSWDWDMVNQEQIRTFPRSIELNTTILKGTYDGFTYVSGPWGLYGDVIDFRGRYQTVEFIDVPVWKK